MTPFSQASETLSSLGFTCLPIIPPTESHQGRGKAPGEYVSGGWRGMVKWQRFRDAKPGTFELKLWGRFPNANIGVVMGTHVRDDLHVGAVDFDATDPDVLDALLRAAPASPMVKRGQKGETRFYLMPKSMRSKPYDGPDGRLVDLLTGFDCRQTVVPPSVHPTGAVYAWTAGPVAAHDLPVFGADELDVLQEALEAAGWSADAQRPGKTVRASSAPLDPDSATYWDDIKAAALADLPAWVPALDLYDLRPARGGFEAVAHWRASSSGRAMAERKRNLSIQANGIKDFGTNDTYSAIDLVMQARGVDQAQATAWLRERLEPADEGGVVIALRPREAVQNLCTSPERVQETAKIQHVAPSHELPDALTRIPGLLGALTDWITDSARRPQRGLALGAALTLIGTAAGRRYSGPTRTGTHLYVLGLARTSAGKDHPLNCVQRVLTAATMQAHIGPSQFMSMSALIRRLARQPLTLSAIDEFGSFLARINGRKASTHERAITGVLRTAWGASFNTMAPPEWAGMSSEPIHSPALSLYAVSTHEEFFAALDGGDVFNGFLNRFLTIGTMLRPAEQEPTADAFSVPESVVAGMIDIYQAGGALARSTIHNDAADAPLIVVPWADAQAQRVYQRFGREVEARESDIAFLARSVEMAQRMAVIRAIGMDPKRPAVTVEDMEWGREVALWSAERMMADAGDYMAETQLQGEAQRILRIVKERGRIQHSALVLAMKHRMRTRDLKELVDSLREAGQLVVETERPASGGVESKWYRAA